MSSSEIAKLESRWRENPQGLTFAPLAEAYRKMRDIPRALEVLTEGLGRHPDYIPASIVLGRCQLDLGNDEQAAIAFNRVLELDDENVIALKALAEIAERQGRLDEAGSRLLALLQIDRNNDEARIQLARVEAAREAGGVPVAGAAALTESSSEVEMESHAEPATDAAVDIEPGSETGPAADFERELEPALADAEQLADLEDNLHTDEAVEQLPDLEVDDVPDISSETAEAPAMPGLVGQDFHEHSAGVTPLEDLAPGNVSLGSDDLIGDIESSEEIQLDASGNSEYQLSSATDDWATTAERASGSEYQLPSAADELIADAVGRAEDEFIDPLAAEYGSAIEAPEAAAEPAAVEESAAVAEPAAREPADDEIAADFEESAAFEPPVEFAPAAVAVPDLEVEDTGPSAASGPASRVPDPEPEEGEDPDADLVVTESMAELFLRQGHRAEALRVYRALYRQNRGNLSLREKVDELETALAAEQSAPQPAMGFVAPDPSRSVAAFLSGILQARPADAPAGWDAASGAAQGLSEPPSAAADDADAEPTRPASDHLSLSAVFGEEGSPVPPATPAGVAGDDGISFDAFFGGEQSGGAPRQRSASREDDDLDQFHAWLQNLKR